MRYGATLAAVVLVGLVTEAIPLLRDRFTFFLLWPLIFFTSWFAGPAPGILATLASALLAALALGSTHAGFPTELEVTLLGTFIVAGLFGVYVANARDVLVAQQQRAAAAALLAQADAERSNRAKDAFLATMSHELRTPLSPILAWSRMLREGQLDTAERQKAIAVIERSAQAQAKLIEDLLDVSRIAEGKLRLQVRPFDLNQVVENAVETVRPAAEARSIRLQVVLDSSGAVVSGDPDRLQQLVWNLLSNAVKFTPKGGRVHVTLERVNSHVEIAISDTGEGLAPEQLAHIFDRFWQADASTTRTHGGLGLGLAIARQLAELHGGTLVAESAGEGQGSTFTVKLPVVPFSRRAGEAVRRHPMLAAAEEAGPQAPELDSVRILLVDDDPDTNEAMRVLLGRCGAEVRVAASAAHALEILGRWTPDVLVSDVGMPDEDGYTLLARVRQSDSPLARIPAIALTAYASVEDRVRLLSAGFQMHLAKPADLRELTAAIRVVLRGAGPASGSLGGEG
ncbi:MAG TPA: ATP-binding protein [Myxococcota bacterium]|nr:ATP-binding protein [Myxococcota bacterium]